MKKIESQRTEMKNIESQRVSFAFLPWKNNMNSKIIFIFYWNPNGGLNFKAALVRL